MITAIVLSVIIPTLVLTLAPFIVKYYGGETKRYRLWLIAGCSLYVISWLLPSPLIEGKDTSFMTHFVGGGVFTGFIWYYIKQSLSWSGTWLLEAFSLFALVSAFGVANELFEIVLYLFGRMPHGIGDTSWDLLANTLGSLFFYCVYAILLHKKR